MKDIPCLKTDTFPAKRLPMLLLNKVKHITGCQEVIHYLEIFVYISNNVADDVIKC